MTISARQWCRHWPNGRFHSIDDTTNYVRKSNIPFGVHVIRNSLRDLNPYIIRSLQENEEKTKRKKEWRTNYIVVIGIRSWWLCASCLESPTKWGTRMKKTTFDDYIFVNIVKIVHIPAYTHTQYKAKYHLRNTIVAYLALLSAYNSTKFYFFFSFVVSIRLNMKRKFRIRSKNFPSIEKLVAFENLSTLLITLKVRKYNGCVSVEVPL